MMSSKVQAQVKPNSFAAVPVSGVLQRKCACGTHTIAGGDCESCQREKPSGQVQRAAINAEAGNEVPPIVHDVLRSPGQPLDAHTRSFFALRFAHDFSHVRVHTDAQAAESARSVNALAYTVGRDVVFGAQQYAPQTNSGRRLLAHELAHVAQNRGGQANGFIEMGQPNSVAETEAANAEIGLSAPLSGDAHTILRRQPQGGNQPQQCAGWTCLDDISKCDKPDPGKEGNGSPSTSWSLSAMIDVDVPEAADVSITSFGHSYVKFNESNGAQYTYGFYPRTKADVVLGGTRDADSCMVHPDTTHTPCVDQEEKYPLTKAEYEKALEFAGKWCVGLPKYHLFNLNCTTFVAKVVESAGKAVPTYRGPVSKAQVTADNPNTLLDSIRARDKAKAQASKPEKVRLAEEVINFAQSQELRMGFSLLNGLSMVMMLDVMEELEKRKYLDQLINSFPVAREVNKPRLNVAMRAVKLKVGNIKPSPEQIAGVLALAPDLPEPQKTDVTAYLNR